MKNAALCSSLRCIRPSRFREDCRKPWAGRAARHGDRRRRKPPTRPKETKTRRRTITTFTKRSMSADTSPAPPAATQCTAPGQPQSGRAFWITRSRCMQLRARSTCCSTRSLKAAPVTAAIPTASACSAAPRESSTISSARSGATGSTSTTTFSAIRWFRAAPPLEFRTGTPPSRGRDPPLQHGAARDRSEPDNPSGFDLELPRGIHAEHQPGTDVQFAAPGRRCSLAAALAQQHEHLPWRD